MTSMQKLINCKHGPRELHVATRVGDWKYECPECHVVHDIKPGPRVFDCRSCKTPQIHDPVEAMNQGELQMPFDRWKCRSCGTVHVHYFDIPPSHGEYSDEGYFVTVNEGHVIGGPPEEE